MAQQRQARFRGANRSKEADANRGVNFPNSGNERAEVNGCDAGHLRFFGSLLLTNPSEQLDGWTIGARDGLAVDALTLAAETGFRRSTLGQNPRTHYTYNDERIDQHAETFNGSSLVRKVLCVVKVKNSVFWLF
jgi:hypothetical protein